MNYWLAPGTVTNWLAALEHGNTWGLKDAGRQARAWEQAQSGDVILFYVVAPVRGIVGYGVVLQKLKQSQPLWPEEVQTGRVIWPLRLVFEVKACVPPDRWQEERAVNDGVNFRAKLGFRQVSEELAQAVLAPFQATALAPDEEVSIHSQTIETLLEIGRLQNYFCNKEYPMEKTRLDAVWKRVPRSVPNFVFEVQIGGNPYQALGKLKHAYDLWNSNIYLVAREVDKPTIEQLVTGTYHEIQDKLHIIDLETVGRLSLLKRQVRSLEAQLGLAAPTS